jgi:hypothetical protein
MGSRQTGKRDMADQLYSKLFSANEINLAVCLHISIAMAVRVDAIRFKKYPFIGSMFGNEHSNATSAVSARIQKSGGAVRLK